MFYCRLLGTCFIHFESNIGLYLETEIENSVEIPKLILKMLPSKLHPHLCLPEQV